VLFGTRLIGRHCGCDDWPPWWRAEIHRFGAKPLLRLCFFADGREGMAPVLRLAGVE